MKLVNLISILTVLICLGGIGLFTQMLFIGYYWIGSMNDSTNLVPCNINSVKVLSDNNSFYCLTEIIIRDHIKFNVTNFNSQLEADNFCYQYVPNQIIGCYNVTGLNEPQILIPDYSGIYSRATSSLGLSIGVSALLGILVIIMVISWKKIENLK